MKKLIAKINIKGVEYKIFTSNPKTDESLTKNDGYCDYSKRAIVIDEEAGSESYRQHVLTHEIVHAFTHECGLRGQGHASWASDEEVIDWIAAIVPSLSIARKTVIKEYSKHLKNKKQPEQKTES